MVRRQPLYRYSPLDVDCCEIRLLAVQPQAQSAELDGIVRCDTCHVSLREMPCPQYEAVSYVWGSAQSKKDLLLDGIRVTVPASAVEALQRIHLNGGEQERLIWIDVICIS
ncbi:hypothetical protein GQ44DRAFT_623736 [Phaeosphaeriaceae sp. PMI808]|nr:hypothetical protein GQ44DRAFT_623736 [Phaeosphaeriaceae sp. PMI808]